MEYSELIGARYSVRAYRPDPVEEENCNAFSKRLAWRRPRQTGSLSN